LGTAATGQRWSRAGGGANGQALKNANYSERDAALSSDEALNVRIYRQASPAVANVLTKATSTISGWTRYRWREPARIYYRCKGYILTNFHVVEGAQTIEVVLGDQSRHTAKFMARISETMWR